jgi:hypothetical protein
MCYLVSNLQSTTSLQKKVATPKPSKNISSVELSADIKIIEGDTRILLITPHGVMSDDDNTDLIAFEVQNRLKCYAIVNDEIQRDVRNFNSCLSASGILQPFGEFV